MPRSSQLYRDERAGASFLALHERLAAGPAVGALMILAGIALTERVAGGPLTNPEAVPRSSQLYREERAGASFLVLHQRLAAGPAVGALMILAGIALTELVRPPTHLPRTKVERRH